MQKRDVGRVVVGVDDSLAGLRALRQAVELAREHDAEVRAVRACRFPDPGRGCWHAGMGPVPAYAAEDVLTALRRDAAAAVARAFDQAMGGMPDGVVVCVEPTNRPLHRVLLDSVGGEGDLLVVAEPRPSHGWPAPRSVARRCLARASCPVLVVPAPQGARELGRWQPWRRLRRRRELADLLDSTTV